jgi:RimJ/RimL family protein N-acetyltransferase
MRFPEDVPVLTDGVVTLRAHTIDDLPQVIAMCQDPRMQRWTTIPVPYERHHAEQFLCEQVPAGWRDGGRWSWAIEYDGRFAGTVGLHDGEGGVGEIGFGLGPWARGAGVMTRATRLVVGHAFDTLGWGRVIWRAFVGNWASRRVAWKVGFRHLTTIHGGGRSRGVRLDEWVASIGRDDEREAQGHWWDIPVLDGDGFRLRPFQAADVKRTAEACADERTQQWLPALPSPYLPEHAEGYIESRLENAASGEGVSWAVADCETDELLANVSIFDLKRHWDPTSGEVGYWSHPDARGRGLMTAAVGRAIRFAFLPLSEGGLGRRRLTLFAAEGNTASARVAVANGFTMTGTQRAATQRRGGGYADLLSFDLLASDHA